MSIHRRAGEEEAVPIHKEYCSEGNKGILPFATARMNLEGVGLNKINQIKTDTV